VDRHLIVGLGNPGSKYRETRHNIGFAVVDRLAERHRARLSQEKFDGQFGSGRVAGQKAFLLKPETFMNRSGESVGPAVRYYELPADRIVVVHDDVDLDLGRLKVKTGGGHGGHNGLKSIGDALGTSDFIRVRCGVGRPEHGAVKDHVLGRFRNEERSVADEVIELACDAVECVITEGPGEAQNRFNGRDVSA
jgi:PTH1 family peptidyl-tRNA hydrolase